jgi:hypothetical protein
MKKFLIYTFATLSLSFILTGCSEDFLKKTPIGAETNATFYTTEENCEMAVTAAYAVLITRHGFSRNYWAFGDVASDDSEAAGEKGGGDQPYCQRIDQLQIVPGNAYLVEFYGDISQGIFRCNVAIENIPQAEFDQNKKNRLIAEARFLRAFFHFHMNVVFGGIRIVDHVLLPEEYAGSRNTVAEVLHFVQTEMAEAANSLPATYPNSDKGRATKGAALGYQLKALVFESSYAQLAANGGDPANYFEGCTEKWDEAVNVFNAIEALGVHELEPNYADLWPVYGENSSELMFTGHSVSLQAGSGIEDINNRILGGVHCVYQACRSYYNESGGIEENGRSGLYGLNAPTFELRDEFEAGDPRLDLSFCLDSELIILTTREGIVDTLPACPSFASPTAMNNQKYDPLPWEWVDPIKHFGPRDLKFLRYADVLLLAAEAALNDDNPTLALQLVNRVRTRARNSGTSGVPADLTSITLADIQHERRVELALEAHRYFDIVRWGLAEEKLTGMYRQTDLIANPDAAPLVWTRGKHEFFPIPESEIALNQGLMAQNPGY